MFWKKLLLPIFILLISHTLSAQHFHGNKTDIHAVLDKIKAFSEAVVESDYDAIANSYTLDGKIFPSGTEIISGRKAIKERWILPEGVSITHHRVVPMEIRFLDDYAHDFGHYFGTTRKANGEEVSWKGKYVIVWKKVDGEWLIYLDIWNRIDDKKE